MTHSASCAEWQEALSAAADNEASSELAVQASAHARGCVECRAFSSGLTEIKKRTAVRSIDDVPNLVGAILERAHPPRVGWSQWIRYALAYVALAQLCYSIRSLLLGEDPGTTVHQAHHLGSLSAAFALGMLYAAWKPHRAYGLLPLAGALATTLVITSVIDISQGRTTSVSELHHLLDVAAVALLWMLAGSPLFLRRRAISA